LVLQQVIIISHGKAHCCWRFNMSLLFHIEKFTPGVSTIKRSLFSHMGKPTVASVSTGLYSLTLRNSQLAFQWSTGFFFFISHGEVHGWRLNDQQEWTGLNNLTWKSSHLEKFKLLVL
jgi:MFS-type transporter involved in bile tolerance (Atg22 family)